MVSLAENARPMPIHLIDCTVEYHEKFGEPAMCGCPCHPSNKIVTKHPVTPGLGGPPCIWDNAPTRRAGSCWVCIACGNSTSC